MYCTNSVWIGDEKSARNPFAALQGDPLYAVEVLREDSINPDAVSKVYNILWNPRTGSLGGNIVLGDRVIYDRTYQQKLRKYGVITT